MRLFVAAEPSDRVRRSAGDAVKRLRDRLDARNASHGIRWISPANLHLTLWFLGEVPEGRRERVIEALRPRLLEPCFALHVSGFGAFPPSGPPRVLWLGVVRGHDALSRLHDEIGARLLPMGFESDGRPYSAHLTVARIKDTPAASARRSIRDALAETTADAGDCRVDCLTVFSSRTLPEGAEYEPLLRVPLH